MRNSTLIFVILLFVPALALAQFSLFPVDFQWQGKTLINPMTGGFTNAQFNNCDLNRDGIQDLVVFDREGNVIRCFIYNPDNEQMEYSAEYNELFPEELDRFLLIRDYNNDGIEDLFSFSHIPGIAGVQVFRGSLDNGVLTFQRHTFPNHRDIIEYETRNGNFVNAYVSSIDHPAMADIDQDGDLDLLSFEPGGSYIYYYKNTAVENGYSLDSLNFVLEDDCWAKIYEAESSEALSLSDDPDKCAQSLSGDGAVSTRHSGSTLNLLDINGDGLMDLLIGDLSSPNIVALYNGGTLENAFGTSQETMYPTDDLSIDFQVFISTYYIDVDNDGVKELIASPNTPNSARNQDNIWLYENDVIPDVGLNPRFVQSNFLLDETLDLSGTSVPAIADVNQDGLTDIVVGTYGYQDQTGQIEPRVFLFTNIGTATSPEFELTDEDYLQLSEYKGNQYFSFAPAFGDIDNDGDIDLIMGNYTGELFYFENTAGPNQTFEFAEEIVGYMDIDVGQFSVPQIIDVNQDGLPDLLVGERNGNSLGGGACGNINYFQNAGTKSEPFYMPEADNAPNTPCFAEIFTRAPNSVTGYSSPQLIPFEDKYWVLTGSESLQAILYQQEGDVFDPFVLMEEQWGDVYEGNRTHPRLADLNNDGKFEMIIGNSRGGLAIYGTNATVEGELTATKDVLSKNVQVYPNPGQDYLKIRSKTASGWDVRMYNSSGQLVKVVENAHIVNTSGLQAGVYILHLRSELTTKILKWLKY